MTNRRFDKGFRRFLVLRELKKLAGHRNSYGSRRAKIRARKQLKKMKLA